MPCHPLSDEASAKIRQERLLEREKRAREADGLEGCGVERISKKIEQDCVSDDCGDDDGDGQPLRREVVR
jgi:hypothetical protein